MMPATPTKQEMQLFFSHIASACELYTTKGELPPSIFRCAPAASACVCQPAVAIGGGAQHRQPHASLTSRCLPCHQRSAKSVRALEKAAAGGKRKRRRKGEEKKPKRPPSGAGSAVGFRWGRPGAARESAWRCYTHCAPA